MGGVVTLPRRRRAILNREQISSILIQMLHHTGNFREVLSREASEVMQQQYGLTAKQVERIEVSFAKYMIRAYRRWGRRI